MQSRTKKKVFNQMGVGSIIFLLASLTPLFVHAATSTWIGVTSNDWATASNWDTNAVPNSSTDVLIATNSPNVVALNVGVRANFHNLTLQNSGKIFFNGGVISNGTNITLQSGGQIGVEGGVTSSQIISGDFIALSGSSVDVSNNGNLGVFDFTANNIDIEANAVIDARFSGYYTGAPGPGDGSSVVSGGAGGGANGGNGGAGTSASGGTAYCLTTAPTWGSAGGSSAEGNGGLGGGLIKLRAANTLTINGYVLAGAHNAFHTTEGGGAGGGIFLSAPTVTGTPQEISAYGGNSTNGGGGGGGCVRLEYSVTSTFGLSALNVSGGTGNVSGGAGQKIFASSLLPAAPLLVNANVSVAATDATIPSLLSSTTTAVLTWVSGHGGESSYSLERSTDGISYVQVVTSSPTSTTYTFTGLSPATTYWFRIAAVGFSATSTYVTVGPLNTNMVVPAAPTLSGVTSSTINLVINQGTNSVTNTYFSVVDNNSTPYAASGAAAGSVQYYTNPQWAGIVNGLTPSTTYYFNVNAYIKTGLNTFTFSNSASPTTSPTTTLLATPSAPVFMSETSSTLNLTWSQNGNPSTTPYAVYNQTLNMYHAANGLLSASPVFFPLASWNGVAKGLSPSTLYNIKIVLQNENATQNATSSALGDFTLTSSGGTYSTGGSGGTSSGSASISTSSPANGSSWYFTGTGSTTSPSTLPVINPVNAPTTLPQPGSSSYTLPDGTIITPQMVFGMMNSFPVSTAPSVTLYRGKNLSSNIRFSNLPTTSAPLKTGKKLVFRYDYTNPNTTRTYRIERVLLNPLGKIISVSTASAAIKIGKTVTYRPTQIFAKNLTSGLYTLRVRITSPTGKTVYDENTFDVELEK